VLCPLPFHLHCWLPPRCQATVESGPCGGPGKTYFLVQKLRRLIFGWHLFSGVFQRRYFRVTYTAGHWCLLLPFHIYPGCVHTTRALPCDFTDIFHYVLLSYLVTYPLLALVHLTSWLLTLHSAMVPDKKERRTLKGTVTFKSRITVILVV
jgi:hypothetical protein